MFNHVSSSKMDVPFWLHHHTTIKWMFCPTNVHSCGSYPLFVPLHWYPSSPWKSPPCKALPLQETPYKPCPSAWFPAVSCPSRGRQPPGFSPPKKSFLGGLLRDVTLWYFVLWDFQDTSWIRAVTPAGRELLLGKSRLYRSRAVIFCPGKPFPEEAELLHFH